MANARLPDEIIAAVDADCKPLSTPVLRAEAHHEGIWHLSVSIFVVNRLGELLVERRSENKDLFPGYYDIVGGHLKPGQSSADAAIQEIQEELGVTLPHSRLERLTQENSLKELVVLPSHGIINREFKTVYLVRLTAAEEMEIRRLAAHLLRLSSEELEERGATGEVSQIEFWPWERLLEMSLSTEHRPIASGTLSALGDQVVHANIERCCLNLRETYREDFAREYHFLSSYKPSDARYDQDLLDRFLEHPSTPASEEQVNAIFARGTHQLGGAYQLGAFRQAAIGDDYWALKIQDPETRYVKNLLSALGFNQSAATQHRLNRYASELQAFVAELLNLPLSSGMRLRDTFSNLVDIGVARKAVLVWLENRAPGLPSEPSLQNPTQAVTRACLEAGYNLLDRFLRSPTTPSGQEFFSQLVLLGLGASAADFNNPLFQGVLRRRVSTVAHITEFLDDRTAREFNADLGGEHFLSEFYADFIATGKAVRIAYLAGNAAQACTSLAIAQEILRANERASIQFITKASSSGNDLTLPDAVGLIERHRREVFSDLSRFLGEKRFALERDGPHGHGLDPSRLSAGVAKVLGDAHLILAEGQGYAEICGWKKPTYISFRVNGRVAEAIHGVPRSFGASGFVRLTPGVDHFQDFASVVRRSVLSSDRGQAIPVAAQTTAEYVRAVLGENLKLITEHIFKGEHLAACERLNVEAAKLGRTFSEVLTGAASRPPESAAVGHFFREKRFPVFACGGGGGFTAVTLQALRMLKKPVVAGVPATDDGGSTGQLQSWLRSERGFVFGVGDMAAILQEALPDRCKQALLAFRFDEEPDFLTTAVIRRIVAEIEKPTHPEETPIGASGGFLSFTCDQLNLARVIDKAFRDVGRNNRLPVKGASIRNLNVAAAYELCGALGDRTAVPEESRLAAYYVLHKALGLPADLLVLPVTYGECVLFTEYGEPVSTTLSKRFHIPDGALKENDCRLYGQQYIDKLPQVGQRLNVGVARSPNNIQRPSANPDYLARLRQAEIFVMGAGSLIGSQLSQLAIPGVVDVLLERPEMRRILVLNHVRLDETLGMTLSDQVRLIEAVATGSASKELRLRLGIADQGLRISSLFTDIVVPRTIAKELEVEMSTGEYAARFDPNGDLQRVTVQVPNGQAIEVPCNRYVTLLVSKPELITKYDITPREIKVLSRMDHPVVLQQRRTEGGRYRGALFAMSADIEYLESRGIQRRRIHEVDSIGEVGKFLKATGAPEIEFFPGLVPEALLGIFRIALEQVSSPAKGRANGS